MELDEGGTTEPVTPPAQEQVSPDTTSEDGNNVSAFAACSGYDGNNYCFAECNDTINYWYVVGHVSTVGYGNCASAAFAFCRSIGYNGHNGACWGYP
ncbi:MULTISPECIES: hypothetical protein [Myxococcus]|uniref:Uncharacterized protein n=1 Tax=Myxococcus llanfairpwllgwyngyllgogerychwyrndrobwllllantysiliogogogochensis TaxID=2590453 RepID=A0A540WHX8_9BACT|nr:MULTISPECIES: hypothetical protein [Myxococcus]NTX04963.1 hypothetical protein [Myxococcus sp. CA040A]NTX37931.1 hypothetical protein [Myxococcus sp. CA033]TQF08625.1 hypothetical protein FJV41_48920 [Myxococcus llanfairpwllgwyngyllgogerychwyrndrobwllllantysiliogogogochensis]